MKNVYDSVVGSGVDVHYFSDLAGGVVNKV